MKPSWSIFNCRYLISFRLPLTMRSVHRKHNCIVPMWVTPFGRRGALLARQTTPKQRLA
jgi:hypothetical protein